MLTRSDERTGGQKLTFSEETERDQQDNTHNDDDDGEEGVDSSLQFGGRWSEALGKIEEFQMEALSGHLSEQMTVISQIIDHTRFGTNLAVGSLELGQQSMAVSSFLLQSLSLFEHSSGGLMD